MSKAEAKKFLQFMSSQFSPENMTALRLSLLEDKHKTATLELISAPVHDWMYHGRSVIRAHMSVPVISSDGYCQFGIDWFFVDGGVLSLRSDEVEVVRRIEPYLSAHSNRVYPRRVVRIILSILHRHQTQAPFSYLLKSLFRVNDNDIATLRGCLDYMERAGFVDLVDKEVPTEETEWSITELGCIVYAGVTALKRPQGGLTQKMLSSPCSDELRSGLLYLSSLECEYFEHKRKAKEASRPIHEYVDSLFDPGD